jgi:predicted GIY-YIG superfamily endonuclease
MYYIYKLKCINSDDIYIGRTRDIKNRMTVHNHSVKNSESNMYKIIRENGGYEYEILEETDNNEKSKELERHYYEMYKPSLNSNYPARFRKEYFEMYYAKNKDYFVKYYKDNKSTISEVTKKYYQKNQEFYKRKSLLRYHNRKSTRKSNCTTITYCNVIVDFD